MLARALVTVCAWCTRHIKGPKNARYVTHGICWWCEESLMEETVQVEDPAWGLWLDLGGEGG